MSDDAAEILEPRRSATPRSLPTHPLRTLLDRRFLQHSTEHVLAVGSSAERAELRVGLESDLGHLLEVSQIYKRAIIASAPISRLPPEIMSLVFTRLAWIYPPVTPRNALEGADALAKPEVEEPPYVYRNWGRRGSLGWAKCAHVCRSWRSILLNMKSLWAEIVGILPAAIPEMLERAGNRPIHLVLRETLERRIAWLDWEALKSSASIHSIHVVFTLSSEDTDEYMELCHFLHCKVHPVLETLDIFGNMAIHTESFQKELGALLIAPSMRNLRLNNFFTFFGPCPLRALSLNFNEYHDETEPEMPLLMLLELIYNVRNTLEDLELSSCFSRASLDVPTEGDITPVDLYRLLRMRLVGRVSDVEALLGSCLLFPPSCTTFYRLVDKEADDLSMRTWTFDTLRRTMTEICHALPEGHTVALRLHHAWDADDDLDIHSWHCPYVDFWHAPTADMHSSAVWERIERFRWYSPSLNLFPLTRTLFDPEGPNQGRALPQIHVLRITHRPSFYMSDFELMCVSRQLPNVRLVIMDAPCTMIFLNHTLGSWRGLPTEAAHEAVAPALLFPHLEAVWMTKGAFKYDPISCERLVTLIQARVTTTSTTESGTHLLRRLRVDAGIPFSDPQREEWAVQQLRSMVELRWMV